MDSLIAKLLDKYDSIGIVTVCAALVVAWISKQWLSVQGRLDLEKEKRLNDYIAFFSEQSSVNRDAMGRHDESIRNILDAYRDRGKQ